MKISTKGRYALRLMMDLALNCANEPIPLKEISGRQDISEKYLEQIIAPIGKAGLVKSIRGSQGGYYLSLPAKDITVGMILRITEGSLSPVDCLDSETCTNTSSCVTINVWKKLKEAIENVVDNITLQDLVDDSNSKNIIDFCI